MAELERSMKEEKDLQQRPPTNLEAPPSAKLEPGAPPESAADATRPVPEAAGAAAPGSVPLVSATPAPAAESGATNYRHVAMWSAAGVAGVGLVLGVIETFAWRSKVSAFDDHLGPSTTMPGQTVKNCGADDPNRGGPGCSDLYDSASSALSLAITGYVVGVLAGAGAAALYLTEPHPQQRSGVALRCGPGPGSVGLLCGGSF
jgi:hypothetical protein